MTSVTTGAVPEDAVLAMMGMAKVFVGQVVELGMHALLCAFVSPPDGRDGPC